MAATTHKLKVYLCHARENQPIVKALYDRLVRAGYEPWMDSELLLPGMNDDLETRKALRASDVVIVCLSKISVAQEGRIQTEFKIAQDILAEKPSDTIFLIPLRLDDVDIPFELRDIHWGDYTSPNGFEMLVGSLNRRAEQLKREKGKVAPAVARNLSADTASEAQDTIQLILDGHFEDFTEAKKNELQAILAVLLRVDIHHIKISKVMAGSVIVEIRLEASLLPRLISLVQGQEPQLVQLRVQGLRLSNNGFISMGAGPGTDQDHEAEGPLVRAQKITGAIKAEIPANRFFELGDNPIIVGRIDRYLRDLLDLLSNLRPFYESRPLGESNPYYDAIGASEKLQVFVEEVRRKDKGSQENTKQLRALFQGLEEAIFRFTESQESRTKAILADPMDGREPQRTVPNQRPRSQSKGQPPIDVVILTVREEEYQAVCQQLQNLQTLPGTQKAPNLYAWKTGTVLPQDYEAAYRVAVGMTGRAGNPHSAIATQNAITLWNPRYVFFCGIAGGLMNFRKYAEDPNFKPDIHLGDIVIADVIHGYEYGKIEASFHPRDDWTYRTDQGLWNKALAYKANPAWLDRISGRPPRKHKPRILEGQVASGDKVVDNPANAFFTAIYRKWPKIKAVEMEGAGVAAAIDQARDSGRSVGFLMVRGISDLPRPPKSIESFQKWEEKRGTQERDNWTPYAAEVAAAVAVGLIAEGLPVPPKETK
jgi:nucleoside phosphorylase